MVKAKAFVSKVFHPLLKSRRRYIFSVTVLLLLGAIFLFFTWCMNMQWVKDDAMRLAETAENMLCKGTIGALSASPEDIDKPEYWELKFHMMKLVQLNNQIRFAYLYTQKDGRILFMVDSEPSDSPDCSPRVRNILKRRRMYLCLLRMAGRF